eukprot:8984647-Ditylum_brightwellii.AAC.1
MYLFQDKDVKKAIRASVSSIEVGIKVMPHKDAVSQALSTPYMAPKKTASLAATLLRSLNQPISKRHIAREQPAAIMSLGRH